MVGGDRAMARLEPQFFLARTWLGSLLARQNLARLGSSQDLLARQYIGLPSQQILARF